MSQIKLSYIGIIFLFSVLLFCFIYQVFRLVNLQHKKDQIKQKILQDRRNYFMLKMAQDINEDFMKQLLMNQVMLVNLYKKYIDEDIMKINENMSQFNIQIKRLMRLIKMEPNVDKHWINQMTRYFYELQELTGKSIHFKPSKAIDEKLNIDQKELLWNIISELLYNSIYKYKSNSINIELTIHNNHMVLYLEDDATVPTEEKPLLENHIYLNKYLERLKSKVYGYSFNPTQFTAQFPLV